MPPTPCPSCGLGFYDLAAAADRLGISARTISRYLATGAFPDPDLRIANSPVWTGATITAWETSRAAS